MILFLVHDSYFCHTMSTLERTVLPDINPFVSYFNFWFYYDVTGTLDRVLLFDINIFNLFDLFPSFVSVMLSWEHSNEQWCSTSISSISSISLIYFLHLLPSLWCHGITRTSSTVRHQSLWSSSVVRHHSLLTVIVSLEQTVLFDINFFSLSWYHSNKECWSTWISLHIGSHMSW